MINLFKKILIVFLGSLCLLSTNVFGTLDDAILYYSFDNGDLLTDLSGNGNSGTNTGATSGATGILNEAYSFDGINDRINTNYNLNMNNDFTISMWVYSSDVTPNDNIFLVSNGDNSVGFYYAWEKNFGNDRIRCGSTNHDFTKSVLDNTWNHVIITYDDSANSIRYYVAGSLIDSRTCNLQTTTEKILLNSYQGSNSNLNGKMDEFAIYNRVLSSTEISQLYNSGNALNPYGAPTNGIQTDIKDFYNSSSIDIEINTSNIGNLSYSLNNGTLTSICNDCNNSILNLNSLSEGSHSILFESVDENGAVNTTQTFTIDTIKPVQQNNIAEYLETYTLNNIEVNVTEDYLNFCVLEFQDLTNQSCTETEKEFLNNGNQTIKIKLKDLAGNYNEYEIQVFINPKIEIKFSDGTDPLNNFFIDGEEYIEKYIKNVYDFGLGSHILEFTKDGYITTEFTLELNSNSKINTTIEVPKAHININIYDAFTRNKITGTTFEISMKGKSAGEFSTSNGEFKIEDNALKGDYTFLIKSQNNSLYETKEFYQYFDGQSALDINGYFIPLDSEQLGFVTISAIDSDGAPFKYKRVYAIDTSGNQEVIYQEGRTSGTGEAELKVILEDVFYKFCLEEDEENFICTNEDRITFSEDGKVVLIQKESVLTSDETIFNLIDMTMFNWNYNKTKNPRELSFDLGITNDKPVAGAQLCFEFKKIGLSTAGNNTNCEELNAGITELSKNYMFNNDEKYTLSIYIEFDGKEYPYFDRNLDGKETFVDKLFEKGVLWITLIILAIVSVFTILIVDKLGIFPVLFINLGIIILLWTYYDSIISPISSSVMFTFLIITAWFLKEK